MSEDDSSWQTQTQRVEPAHRRVDAFYIVKPQLCSLCESGTTLISEARQQLDALLVILMAPTGHGIGFEHRSLVR